MQVLFVENAPGFGGSLTGILHLVDAFPTFVHPTLVTAFDPRPFTEIPSRLRVEVVPIDLTRTNHRPDDSFVGSLYRFLRHNTWPWAKHVERVARKHGAEIIHANNLVLGNFGAAVAGWRLGIPVLAHQKGYEHNGRLIREIIQRRWYAHHIATSHSIADHLVDLGVSPERCTMVYDAIIPPAVSPAHDESQEIVIAMHSVLRESKGHEILLRAVAQLAGEPLPRFRVVIAGDPPQPSPYPEQLRSLVRELGIADRVQFLGHVRDPFEMLSTVDISVHASTEPEPFGRVAAESMIMRVPVIAAAGSGAGEYVDAAQAGLTTPPRDVDALARALRQMLMNPDERRRQAERGESFAKTEFAPATIARQLVDIYEAVLARRSPPHTLATPASNSVPPHVPSFSQGVAT